MRSHFSCWMGARHPAESIAAAAGAIYHFSAYIVIVYLYLVFALVLYPQAATWLRW